MRIRLLVMLASCWLLAACGGGGGSSESGPAYAGVTTQATVTTSNAQELSRDAYGGSQLSSSISGVAKGVSGDEAQASLVIAGIVQRSATTALGSQKSAAKDAAATIQETVPGYSGYYSMTVQRDQSGAFTATVTFSDYKESSTAPTLSGSLTVSGPAGSYPSTGDAGSLEPITINFNVTGTSGNQSLGFNGDMTYLDQGLSETVTMSMLITNNTTGRTYWLKDYLLNLSGDMLTISGTYYHPTHGYVVMSTITPLTVTGIDATPTSGELLFAGSNGTKARLTFTSVGYTIEVDAAGSGTFVTLP